MGNIYYPSIMGSNEIEENKSKLINALKTDIQPYIDEAGSMRKLSLKLGKSEKYVQITMARSTLNGLDILWNECKKIK